MTNGTPQAGITFEPAFVPESEIIIPLERVTERPTPRPALEPLPQEPNRLIMNIETTGLNPLKDRLIAIGLQNPQFPDEVPAIIMSENEQDMIGLLLTVINDFGFTELVGYGLSFDYRFIAMKCMKYGIPCKQFTDMSLYDLEQAVAQVRLGFVYRPQVAYSLSDVSDYLFNFPKPFTDAEMIKYFLAGDIEKVRQFASEQITRILLLYQQYRFITETLFSPAAAGFGSSTYARRPELISSSDSSAAATATDVLPEWMARCPIDLSEHMVPGTQEAFICPIDGSVIKRP